MAFADSDTGQTGFGGILIWSSSSQESWCSWTDASGTGARNTVDDQRRIVPIGFARFRRTCGGMLRSAERCGVRDGRLFASGNTTSSKARFDVLEGYREPSAPPTLG